MKPALMNSLTEFVAKALSYVCGDQTRAKKRINIGFPQAESTRSFNE